jgi:hypothetical protein
LEENTLPNARRKCDGGVTALSGMDEIPLANLRRPKHDDATITFDVGVITLPNSRRNNDIDKTIPSDMYEIPLPNYRNRVIGIQPLYLVRSKCNELIKYIQFWWYSYCIWSGGNVTD